MAHSRGLSSVSTTANLPLAGVLTEALSPLLIVNPYGLFVTTTTTRPEIIVEGSEDGQTWREYVFRYKPGPIEHPRAPAQFAHHNRGERVSGFWAADCPHFDAREAFGRHHNHAISNDARAKDASAVFCPGPNVTDHQNPVPKLRLHARTVATLNAKLQGRYLAVRVNKWLLMQIGNGLLTA